MKFGRVEVSGQVHFCEPDGAGVWLLQGDSHKGFTRHSSWLAEGSYRLLPPVQPGKILVILGGFPRGQTVEQARLIPPKFAAKLPATIVAAGEAVIVPPEIGATVTVEPELAVVMGARVRRCSPGEAMSAVLGFTCFNDVTHLPYIREQSDFLRAKSVDTFGPLGPWIDTSIREERVVAGLEISAYVNDVGVQRGNTSEFTHRVGEVVSEASRLFALEPGDLISLGTPLDPATASVGDTVRIEIEGVGILVNHLVAEG